MPGCHLRPHPTSFGNECSIFYNYPAVSELASTTPRLPALQEILSNQIERHGPLRSAIGNPTLIPLQIVAVFSRMCAPATVAPLLGASNPDLEKTLELISGISQLKISQVGVARINLHRYTQGWVLLVTGTVGFYKEAFVRLCRPRFTCVLWHYCNNGPPMEQRMLSMLWTSATHFKFM